MLSQNEPKSRHISVYRRALNWVMVGSAALASVIVLIPLFAIFIYLLYKGVGAINIDFLTKLPMPPGEVGGGMANAIVGSAIILTLASMIGIPFGIGTGIYLSEFGRGKYAQTIRFTADVLNGVPSIVVGIAIYSLVVLRQGHFSSFSGGIALGIMMVPTVARTTEEMLAMVPNNVREAALGLGIPHWRSTLSIAVRTAASGIITGVMLAFARVAGETAPLLFTAFGNQFWNLKRDTILTQPTAALPLQIYTYAISPYDDWHRQAWAGALVLILLIVAAVTAVRIVASRGQMRHSA